MSADNEWWFNLRTQQVEQGLGDPNSERLGPYATEDEAAGVLERMRARNAAWDAQDSQDSQDSQNEGDSGDDDTLEADE